MINRKVLIIAIFLLNLTVTSNCLCQTKPVLLATTTSVENSGLLDILIPIFEKEHPFKVKTIAVGSGQAITMGRRGEADILFVHSEEEEENFIKDGFGILRRPIMYNFFILVGPSDDPAKVRDANNIYNAFKKIAERGSLFISRGDNSGTHFKELKIWKDLNINLNKKRWYQETGLGMGETLNIANDKLGYILTDIATYLTLKKHLNIVPLFDSEKDKNLKNEYSIILVNPKRFKGVNSDGAKKLFEFLFSEKVKKIIKDYGVDKYGKPLFIPY